MSKFAVILCFLAYIFRSAGAVEQARKAERASPPTPVEFRHVVQRYHEYQSGMPLSQVVSYIGPPTKRFVRESEFMEVEEWGWNNGRSLLPQHYDWDQWIDPANPDRWVAVGYIGKDADRKPWAVVKKGF